MWKIFKAIVILNATDLKYPSLVVISVFLFFKDCNEYIRAEIICLVFGSQIFLDEHFFKAVCLRKNLFISVRHRSRYTAADDITNCNVKEIYYKMCTCQIELS